MPRHGTGRSGWVGRGWRWFCAEPACSWRSGNRASRSGRGAGRARTVAAVIRPGAGAGRSWARVAGLVAPLVATPPLIGALPATAADVVIFGLLTTVPMTDQVVDLATGGTLG